MLKQEEINEEEVAPEEPLGCGCSDAQVIPLVNYTTREVWLEPEHYLALEELVNEPSSGRLLGSGLREMETSRESALKHLQKAYHYLERWFEDEGGRGVELADAIDHVGAAIRSLGEEVEELSEPVPSSG